MVSYPAPKIAQLTYDGARLGCWVPRCDPTRILIFSIETAAMVILSCFVGLVFVKKMQLAVFIECTRQRLNYPRQ
jgi:hypothetical protein